MVPDGVDDDPAAASAYLSFTRSQWSSLRAATPLTLDASELDELRGVSECIDLDEVIDVHLPLSRLLNLRVAATEDLRSSQTTFLGTLSEPLPFIIGLAGSVAVGKSTISRLLQALLARWPNHPRVDLVTTDGFLLPNAVLEARGLMGRKGFPESYDVKRLIAFLADLKAGREEVRAPVYSHLVYDIIDGAEQVIRQPDIVIVEGLNVLQAPVFRPGFEPAVVVSDFFDFSIYVDAEEDDIRNWYVERFFALRRTAFEDESSYFHHLASYSDEESRDIALAIWRDVNGVNLRENILPTRNRADLVLEKGPDHAVRRVHLRRL